MIYHNKPRCMFTRSSFHSLLNEDVSTDFTIEIKTENEIKKFEVHKMLIGASCKYFDELLTKDDTLKSVELSSITTFDNMKSLIDIIYGGKLNLHLENIDMYCKLDTIFEVHGLENRISKYLIVYLDKYPTSETYKVIEKYNLKTIHDLLYQYTLKKATLNKVLIERHLVNFTKTEFLTIISADSLREEEYEILKFIEKWICHDKPKRMQYLQECLDEIRHGTVTVQAKKIIKTSLELNLKNSSYQKEVYNKIIHHLNNDCKSDLPNYNRKRNLSWKLFAMTEEGILKSKEKGYLNKFTQYGENLKLQDIPKLKNLNYLDKLYIFDNTNKINLYNHELRKLTKLDIEFDRNSTKIILDNGNILEVGVLNSDGINNNVRYYDLLNKKWSYMPALPSDILFSQVISQGEVIYLIGGFNKLTKQLQNSCFRYEKGQWKEIASMAHKRKFHNCYLSDNKIYALGGLVLGENGKLDISKNQECYDIENNKWTTFQLKNKKKEGILLPKYSHHYGCNTNDEELHKTVYYYISKQKKIYKIDLETLHVSEIDVVFHSGNFDITLIGMYVKHK